MEHGDQPLRVSSHAESCRDNKKLVQGNLMLTYKVESSEIKTRKTFVYPLYDRNCISKIPNAILQLFEAEKERTN